MIFNKKSMIGCFFIFVFILYCYYNLSINTSSYENEADDYINVPIIMYHSVLKGKNDKYIISEANLEEDIKYILDKGYTPVFVSDLIDYVEGKNSIPEKSIVLTFDDGYYNNYLYVLPLAEKYGVKMVLSVIGTYSEDYTNSNDLNPNYAHIPWDNIKDMKKSGYFEIQNHSYNMHTNEKRKGSSKIKGEASSLYKDRFIRDTQKLQKTLIEKCGIYTNTYTYPFGAISDESEEYLKQMGYKASLSCYEGVNKIVKGDRNCLFQLKRYNRSGLESRVKFMNKAGVK